MAAVPKLRSARTVLGGRPVSAVTRSTEVLWLAGALEDASKHPIAAAISAAAREQFRSLSPVTGFANTQGPGSDRDSRGEQQRRTVTQRAWKCQPTRIAYTFRAVVDCGQAGRCHGGEIAVRRQAGLPADDGFVHPGHARLRQHG